jgi:hypothetical protein
LLHMSGYGFAKHGLCYWLISNLRMFKLSRPKVKIFIHFHEVSVIGHFPSVNFWIEILQRNLIAALVRLADGWSTNTHKHATMLMQIDKRARSGINIPVTSNVGEIQNLPSFALRERRAVLFGSEATRRGCIERLGGELALKQLPVSSILEIGTGKRVLSNNEAHSFLGHLTKVDLSEILQTSYFGLVYHRGEELAKSGVLAAYAAHGCIPIVTNAEASVADGLRLNEHILSISACNSINLTYVSEKIFAWYQPHNGERQSASLARHYRIDNGKLLA